MRLSITFDIDTTQLDSYTDRHLAELWHIAQANPADGFANPEPGELAERIGREIIRRFLTNTPPALWNHQGRHHPREQNQNRSQLPRDLAP